MDSLESQASQVPRVHKGNVVCPEHQEDLDRKDPLDPREQLDHLGILGLLESLAQEDQLDLLENLALLDQMELQAFLVHQETPARQERMEYPDNKDHVERRELGDNEDHQEIQEMPECLVHGEKLAHRDQTGVMEKLAQLVHQETKDHQVHREKGEIEASPGQGEHQEKLDHRVHLEREALMGILDYLVQVACQDQQDHLETQATQAQLVSQAHLVCLVRGGRGETGEIQVMMDSLEQQVPLDHRESPVSKALKDLRAQMVIPDLKEPREPGDRLVHQDNVDQLVLLGQMVVQVIGENVASVDPRVTVVQRVSVA